MMTTNRRPWLLPAVLGTLAAVGLALAGCGGSAAPTPAASGTSGSGGTQITIQNYSYDPSTVTVPVGTTVTWTNKDTVQHTVTSADSISTSAKTTGLFDSGLFSTGKTFSFTFTKAGTFFYECTIHFAMPSMHAKVIVQ
jgi:plastocyanin